MGSAATILAVDGRSVIANLHREMMTLARIGAIAAGDIPNGFFDGYQSNAGIDAGLSSNYTYDGTGKKVTASGGNMILISTAFAAIVTPAWAMISLLVKGFDAGDTIQAFFSSATSPSWTELTGLTAYTPNVGASGITQFVSGRIPIVGSSDKSIRTKILMNVSQGLELYGQCVTYE
jgi:hypothetical protein